MQLIGSTFAGGGQPGDFTWMIRQPEYRDALFIFNDNEEQLRAYLLDPTSRAGSAAGGGNAAIRPYRSLDPPQAAGIPTGSHGSGYPRLTDEVRAVIAEALAVVADLVATGRYQRVIYSSEPGSTRLGTGIFEVGDDVKDHIVAGLQAVVDRAAASGQAHLDG